MDIYTLTNGNGLTARITDFGARIVSLLVPDRNGNLCDIVLGFDNLDDYLPQNHLSDFGALIGRYANRIGNGRFTLDGQTFQLPQNNGSHCLHGGPTGWQYARFQLVECSPRSLTLQLLSPDGDNGFPGNVRVRVVYTLGDDNSLDISYHAVTDAPTVINITNHSYFNLNGHDSGIVTGHWAKINAEHYTPVDARLIPLEEPAPVEGTPFDFRTGKMIGRDINADNEQLAFGGGYDHNFVIGNEAGERKIKEAGELYSDDSGICMTVLTDMPEMQFYTANNLNNEPGKDGAVYGRRGAVCFETQFRPDAINSSDPDVREGCILKAGEEFTSSTIYKFSCK